MIIKYDPADGEPRRWDLKTTRILSSEAEAIERVTELEWPDLQRGLEKSSPRAIRAVVWVMLKRTTPTLRYREFDPPVLELGIRYDEQERATLAEKYRASDRLTEAEYEQVLRELEEMAAEERAEAPVPVPDPPAVLEPHPDAVPKAWDGAPSPVSG